MTGNESSEDSDASEPKESTKPKAGVKDNQPAKSAMKKGERPSKKAPASVAFDAETDLKSFNTKKAQLIRETTDKADEE